MAPGQNTSMEYVRLGNSGLKVSKIILGCMSYGSPEWQDWVLGEEESLKHIKAAYDAGINAFDTANVRFGSFSVSPPAHHEIGIDVYSVVKKSHKEPFWQGKELEENGYVNQHGLSRKHIFDSVKLSLERLQLDYIDLLQCHRFDYNTPIEETMQALHDVVKAGYVRYIGMSSCHAYQFHAMQNYAIANKLTPFISMQNHYNLVYREEEREMFPTLKLLNVGSIPWSPLARGLLTRPLNADTIRGKTDRMIKGYSVNEGTEKIVSKVEGIAKKYNVSMAQVALAWVFARPGVTAPIVGTTSLENLHDLLNAVNLKLSAEDLKELEEPYQAQRIYGHS
ncbi:hypothetical protein EST38_g12713 [Candolleomyces aberdarensis]|uniref:NADP-dependent oxidoreductase domain-containing protein n=1 Tax=Candolleomyces aberdarensis TaxID=2316362 RepID=A0A4Q2D404_9AGAR|nr:hypothetical protein EST38_g12713 [Candolleomyces aberdarensis]